MVDEKRVMKVIDLNKDFDASQKRLAELKNNRKEEEIPLNDEYWKALNKHRLAHNK